MARIEDSSFGFGKRPDSKVRSSHDHHLRLQLSMINIYIYIYYTRIKQMTREKESYQTITAAGTAKRKNSPMTKKASLEKDMRVLWQAEE